MSRLAPAGRTMTAWMVSTWLLLLSLALQATSSQSPPVRTRIQASWNAAPLITQILSAGLLSRHLSGHALTAVAFHARTDVHSETVALESESSFFPILEAFLHDPSSPLASHTSAISLTSEQIYAQSLALLSSQSPFSDSPAALDSLKLSLALKETSPKIETFFQIWNTSLAKLQVYEEEDDLIEDVSVVELSARRAVSIQDVDTILADQTALGDGSYRLYSFDHIYPAHTKRTHSPPTAILYASPTSSNLASLHEHLSVLANQEKIHYVLRWKPPSNTGDGRRLMLSGWGAGLDLKRVDYLTIDDRDLSGSGQAVNGSEQRADETRQIEQHGREQHVGESIFDIEDREGISDLVQLKPAQLSDVGLQAAQLIISSSDPLLALKRLSQDFPRYAHKLTMSWEPTINESIREELDTVQARYVEAGRSAVWLNGLVLRENEMRPFTLIRTLRKERDTITSLMAQGLTNVEALDVLAHPGIGAATAPPEPPGRGQLMTLESLGELFDARDEAEGGSLILYLNDLEKDSRYRQWQPSLQTLLQPQFPGQLPQLRRNLVNVIFALDLEIKDAHNLVADNIVGFINRGVGIRFGVLPLLGHDKQNNHSLGEHIAKIIWYLTEKIGKAGAIGFSRELAQVSEERLTSAHVSAAYASLCKMYRERAQFMKEEVVQLHALPKLLEAETEPSLEERVQRARGYGRRLGLKKSDKELGTFFVNGKLYPIDEEYQRNLQLAMTAQTQYITQQYYLNEVDDSTDIADFFYTLPSTYPSRNSHIFSAGEQNPLRFIDIAEMERVTGVVCQSTSETEDAKVSIWLLVNDLQSDNSLNSILAAGECAASDPSVRICLMPIRSDFSKSYDETSGSVWVGSPKSLRNEVEREKPSQSDAGLRVATFARLNKGSDGIIINGRLLDLGAGGIADFGPADYEALVSYEMRKRIYPVLQAVNEAEVTLSASAVAKVVSTISLAYQPDTNEGLYTRPHIRRARDYRFMQTNLTSVSIGDEETALFQFAIILDPLSETAQSWSAIFEALAKMESVHIRLYMNPARGRTEMPLKRFYRYSFESSLSFDSNGAEAAPAVTFSSIPQSTLLTLAMETPSAWQAFPKQSVHDLDNIRLADIKPSARERGVDALFELSNIIVEGHARESQSGAPPRGLQIVLSDGKETFDTLVMANLGYHQLKANPGVWRYSLREGRSSEVFELESISGDDKGEQDVVAVTTFEGVTVFPKLKRKKGMESVDLLDEGGPDAVELAKKKAAEALHGLKNRVQSFFGKTVTPPTSDVTKTSQGGAEINIFTVASGLLYERMAMIMILSVLRNTKSTVKFWFINNFLSPSFKSFIPHLAEAYGFEYELITYTWPSWLRGQKEKQRTIWGYKILFLDVLFPLELRRVIFVDSDQIVRTDLKQLVDLELTNGAPYAYTPMGDDREDMDQYRFWKSGYWRDHLRGLPYHISALYVIDLDRFRQIAAGDRLRGQYQALSADPNSLANLDQDLPNNMQLQIPIHTLDRSWLWCETWCSDESLVDAKTIDLCNNPKTHEPKLARAKRLIPEWTVYDKEIAELAAKVASRSRPSDGGAAADAGQEAGSAADAFLDEAGKLEQAKEQQKEFVKEGTGGAVAADPSSQEGDAHVRDEL